MMLFRISLAILLLTTIHAAAQKNTFPKAFEITADTAEALEVPDANWQYLVERTPLTIAQVSGPEYDSRFKKNDQEDKSYKDYWLRYKVKNKLSGALDISFTRNTDADIYISGSDGKWKHYRTGSNVPWHLRDGIKQWYYVTYSLPADSEITVYKHDMSYRLSSGIAPTIGLTVNLLKEYAVDNKDDYSSFWLSGALFGFLLFAAVFNLFFFYVIRERVYLIYSIALVAAAITNMGSKGRLLFADYPILYNWAHVISLCVATTLAVVTTLLFLNVRRHYPRMYKLLLAMNLLCNLTLFLYYVHNWFRILPNTDDLFDFGISYFPIILVAGVLAICMADVYKKRRSAYLFMIATLPFLVSFVIYVGNFEFSNLWIENIVTLSMLWGVVAISWSLFVRYKGVINENIQQSLDKERLLREQEEARNQLIQQQKIELEHTVETRTAELKRSIEDLKLTQAQLIQKEKMASLGELTAGIAHEIQNPLNFVNNFSEVNREMMAELKEALQTGDLEEALAITADLEQNEEKINHHGKRADGIVKGMLEHSRASTGQKERTDPNKLADEYLRLAYHGLRAKDKTFQAELVTQFGKDLPLVNIVPQDIGRVLLNLFNNAFYATQQKQKTAGEGYQPTIELTTLLSGNDIVFKVKDNGTGIPDAIKEKIMQPFFTTKPTGEGTGLGLSLSYDIVVKGHGGSIEINSTAGEGAEFMVRIGVA